MPNPGICFYIILTTPLALVGSLRQEDEASGQMTESETADTVIKHFVNCRSQSIFGSKTPTPPFPRQSQRIHKAFLMARNNIVPNEQI